MYVVFNLLIWLLNWLNKNTTLDLYVFNVTAFQEGAVRVGPKGYFFSNGFKKEAVPIYNMPLRSDDIFVVTFPKSGW